MPVPVRWMAAQQSKASADEFNQHANASPGGTVEGHLKQGAYSQERKVKALR